MSGAAVSGARGWSEEDRRVFAEEITALNLRRCKVAAVAGSMIALWASLLSSMLPELRFADFREWLATCLGLYAVLLAVRQAVLRPGVSNAARSAYVFTFFVLLVAICDGFFFVLSQQLTAVSSFSRGMLVTAVVFVLPPRRYLPVAAVNELLLCGWLAWRGVNAVTLTAFLDGTAGAVVGSIVSWALYAAKQADFEKQQLIRRQRDDMNELMAVTAHDLRSPLLGVKNLLTLAASRAGLERERLAAVMADAAQACERMLGLVSGLVEAHAAEAAGEVRGAVADLRPALAAAVERARPLAEQKALRLGLRMPERVAPAQFESGALAQVFDNLLGNALKFSPAGSAIEVELEARDGWWCAEVRDEGPGVPPAERRNLFKKYARGTVRPTGGEASSGLGLFIVKTLVERMGGQVAHAARAPQGAVFRVLLPAALPDGAGAETMAAGAEAPAALKAG